MTRHEDVARGIVNGTIAEAAKGGRVGFAMTFHPEIAEAMTARILTALREAEAAGAARENEACAALADAMPKTYLVSGNREKITRPSDVAALIRSRQSPEGE